MTKQYQAGVYEVKARGRGVCLVRLTKSQAKALFQLMEENKLEFESIQFLHN